MRDSVSQKFPIGVFPLMLTKLRLTHISVMGEISKPVSNQWCVSTECSSEASREIFGCCFLTSQLSKQQADQLLGEWITEDRNSIML